MRLIELDPRWFGFGDGDLRLGLTFQCPHCLEVRLGVAFHRKGHELIDDAVIKAKSPNEKVWGLTGTTFDDMTITPSIDAT